jgi:hypothetical protein
MLLIAQVCMLPPFAQALACAQRAAPPRADRIDCPPRPSRAPCVRHAQIITHATHHTPRGRLRADSTTFINIMGEAADYEMMFADVADAEEDARVMRELNETQAVVAREAEFRGMPANWCDWCDKQTCGLSCRPLRDAGCCAAAA